MTSHAYSLSFASDDAGLSDHFSNDCINAASESGRVSATSSKDAARGTLSLPKLVIGACMLMLIGAAIGWSSHGLFNNGPALIISSVASEALGAAAAVGNAPNLAAIGTRVSRRLLTSGSVSCEGGYCAEVVCPLASFCPAGSSTPTPCSTGSFCNTTGLAAPFLCPAGTINPSTGASSASSCTLAPPGTWSSAGSTTASVCSQGTYQPNTGATIIEACEPCGAGYWCASPTSKTACETGTYSSATDATSIATCQQCPAGSWCGAASSAPTPCASGQYSSTLGAISSTICSTCLSGGYCPDPATYASCPAGTYSVATGANSSDTCQPCAAGGFCPSPTTFSACPAGTWSSTTGATSSATCTQCAAGTYNPNTGSTSSSACVPCPLNTYCPKPGSTSTIPCPISSYCGANTVTPRACPAFVATSPYNVTHNGASYNVNIGGVNRTYDFGGVAPFINPITHNADVATIGYYDDTKGIQTLANKEILAADSNSPAPNHVFKYNISDGQGGVIPTTAIGVRANDGLYGSTLRTQLNSYAIPTRVPLIFELEFLASGGPSSTAPWGFALRNDAPMLLWQYKTNAASPPLGITLDQDEQDSTSLQLLMGINITNSDSIRVRGLKPNVFIAVRIEIFLDERPIGEGGQGFLQYNVNDIVVYSRSQQTMPTISSSPYQFSLAAYMYNNKGTNWPLSALGLPDHFLFFKKGAMYQRAYASGATTQTQYAPCL